jgi:hypothetical protein
VNPDYDALYERYLVTIPWTERVDVLGRIVHLFTDQLPFFSLYYDVYPTLAANRLVGVSNGANLWNVQDWDVRS